MVILIGGTTHVGKTFLAQKLMEKHKIPYSSIDHLKMGIYRACPDCGYTPNDNDGIITRKLWPILKGIIMTVIENNQNIILEGNYIPYSLKKMRKKYTSKIINFKMGFSEEYIKQNFQKEIIRNESIIEIRDQTFDMPMEEYITENERVKRLCQKYNVKHFEIQSNFKREINKVYEWILFTAG